MKGFTSESPEAQIKLIKDLERKIFSLDRKKASLDEKYSVLGNVLFLSNVAFK
jgi:hypothetical protein